MSKGLASIISVVLLAAIVVIGAGSMFYSTVGSITEQPTTEKPITVFATAISNDYVTLKVFLVNTGTETIPSGTNLTIAQNGVIATLEEDLSPSSQMIITFSGYDDGKERYFPSGVYTLYGEKIGQAGFFTLNTTYPNTTAPVVVSENSSIDFNPSLEELNGVLYLAWETDRILSDNFEVFIANSSDGNLWSTPIRVSDSQTNKNPSIKHNGTQFGIAWDLLSGNEHIFTKSSLDSTTWSAKSQAENQNDQNLNPVLLVDSGKTHWVTWASSDAGNYDIFLKNATHFRSFNGQQTINVDANVSDDRFPTMIQDNNGLYWIVFQSNRSGTNRTWLTNSSDGVTWTEPVNLPTNDNAEEPSFIQDSNNRYWLAYFTNDGINTHVWIMYSDNTRTWSSSSRISSGSAIERSPFLMQASNGVYWLVYEKSLGGNCDYQIRSTTNALFW